LTGCQTLKLTPADPAGECRHPAKPEKVTPNGKGGFTYADGAAAIYVINQGQAIEVCRALLGHKVKK
jgi:hypothetical protein